MLFIVNFKETFMDLYQISFYAAIFFTVIGALLGLTGIWIDRFFESETCIKLLITDLILAGTSIVVAVITKFLG